MTKPSILSRGLSFAALVLAVAGHAAPAAWAQGAAGGAPLTLAQRQQMRFPQPVRVGDLFGEPVIEAGERLKRLGKVVGVFRTTDGALELVFRYGGWLGQGGRLIAPPLEEVSLVGPMVKINELDRNDLRALPTFGGTGGAMVGANQTIRMGVDRKY
jgi:hypothetical protein